VETRGLADQPHGRRAFGGLLPPVLGRWPRRQGPEAQPEELIALDEALRRLETIEERQSRVVELRYFGGLTIEEPAQVLSISVAIKRDRATARAWLYREVRESLA
jgi:DNA-directed RNA polymerase specialized sigma24 family protein